MTRPFFTIGHSTRPIGELVDLVSSAQVRLVVDVRTVPRSRTNPQYGSEVLAGSLSELQIDYEHIAALGGLRGRQRDVPADVNAFWENRSFHNYADYAMGAEFHPASRDCASWGTRPGAQSCARRPCGGDVIGGSSRTI